MKPITLNQFCQNGYRIQISMPFLFKNKVFHFVERHHLEMKTVQSAY